MFLENEMGGGNGSCVCNTSMQQAQPSMKKIWVGYKAMHQGIIFVVKWYILEHTHTMDNIIIVE